MNKIIIFAAFLALVAGFWFSATLKSSNTQSGDIDPPQKIQGHVLEPARYIAVPPLKKDDGSAFIGDDLKNHWSLLFFGYTNCPDICPTTMSVLAQSKKQAAEKLSSPFPDVYFISVDPQRDEIKMLGEYVRFFDPSFTGVTGETKMLDALTLQAGVVYMKMPAGENKNNYLVDHSAAILLINPEGKLKAYLKAPHSPESILESLKTLIN